MRDGEYTLEVISLDWYNPQYHIDADIMLCDMKTWLGENALHWRFGWSVGNGYGGGLPASVILEKDAALAFTLRFGI